MSIVTLEVLIELCSMRVVKWQLDLDFGFEFLPLLPVCLLRFADRLIVHRVSSSEFYQTLDVLKRRTRIRAVLFFLFPSLGYWAFILRLPIRQEHGHFFKRNQVVLDFITV